MSQHASHAELISQLTLFEKCALLSGGGTFTTRGLAAHGIPVMRLSDGPSGLRMQAGEADHLGLNPAVPATCFPTAVTLASSWDTGLVERVGRAIGEEAAANGVSVLLGPGLCIKRNPLCGRNFEYYSEDPLQAGKVAAAYVRGIQSTGIAACPKHFAANSQELRRMASDSVVDERTLREIYLTGFETCVHEGHPKTIMSSYNLVNGVYSNEDAWLLTDVLRNEWGFDGAVVTDWGGSNNHAAGVAAGSTLEMPAPGLDSVRELEGAVRDGRITEKDVDDRVGELLDLIFDTAPAVEGADGSFDKEGHHQLARTAAAAGIVLLKNDTVEGSPVLPLAANTKVALIGDFADTPRYQGAGSSAVNSTQVDSIRGLIDGYDLDVVGYEKGFERLGAADVGLSGAAVRLASTADVALVCLGLDEVQESEGRERPGMTLAANQVELLRAVRGACKRVVVLLSAGSAVEVGWLDSCDALVDLSLGGQAGAGAALDVVCGAVCPSGKLAETWPVSYVDVPSSASFPSPDRTSEYREGLYVGYRYYQTAGVPMAFPFGFGLSYTTFSYANLTVEKDGSGHPVSASVDVTNTGTVSGSEVVQLYVAKPDHEVFRPSSELKGFAKVALAPGETASVSIPLGRQAFRYWNVATRAWEVEGGTYEVRVGASSEDIRLTASVEVAGSDAKNPYASSDVTPYETGQVVTVTDAQFAAVLGHDVPSKRVTIDRNMCFRDLVHGRSLIFWIVSKVLGFMERSSNARGVPNLNVEFIYNMPLRALAKMAGGMVSMGMVDAIVREVKGWGLVGLVVALVVKLLTGGWFLLVWLVWFLAPVLVEFVINLVRNASGERQLAEGNDNN